MSYQHIAMLQCLNQVFYSMPLESRSHRHFLSAYYVLDSVLNIFTNIFMEHSQLSEVHIIICILQMKKIRLKNIESLIRVTSLKGSTKPVF